VHHCGRFLRIAPEHTSDHVLRMMRKPPFYVLEKFVALFRSINKGLRRKIELAPYLIVGHPGETERDVLEMKEKLRALGLKSTDVQIYTPSPGTLSTAMYYSGRDLSFSPLPVERNVKALVARKRRLVGM
jgi:tRNA A37 methylthiotransferase MiaB